MIKRYDMNWVMSGDSVEVFVTEKPKYVAEDKDEEKYRFTDVDGFEVISGDRAVWYDDMFGDDADENHEYLRICMKNGEDVVFRNSHATLFCW